MASTADRCLKTVNRTTAEILGLLGSVPEGGEPYLVGSLAAGLGTARSDIDVHVFVEGERPHSTPMMFFLGDTIVDLWFHERDAPARGCAALPGRWVRLPAGECALGAPPDRASLALLSRWATGVPFSPECPPLLTPAQLERVARSLVRAALEDALRFAALAGLLDQAGLPSGAAWRRAARAVVEVVLRGRGEMFVGDKWLWAKARRTEVPRPLLVSADAVRSAGDLHRLAETVGPDLAFAGRVVRVVPQGHPVFKLAETDFVLVGREKLCAPPPEALREASVGEAIAANGARLVAELLAERLVELRVDAQALDGEMT